MVAESGAVNSRTGTVMGSGAGAGEERATSVTTLGPGQGGDGREVETLSAQ